MFLEWIGRRQAACFDAESRRSVPLFLPERVLVATETLEFVKSLRIPSRVMDCLCGIVKIAIASPRSHYSLSLLCLRGEHRPVGKFLVLCSPSEVLEELYGHNRM